MEKSSCCYFCFSCLSLVLYESSDSEHSLYNISDWKEKIKVNILRFYSYAMTSELQSICEFLFERGNKSYLEMWRFFVEKLVLTIVLRISQQTKMVLLQEKHVAFVIWLLTLFFGKVLLEWLLDSKEWIRILLFQKSPRCPIYSDSWTELIEWSLETHNHFPIEFLIDGICPCNI